MIQSLYDDSYDVVVCTAGALGKPDSYRQCWDLKLHTYRGLFTLIRMQHRCNDFKRKLKKISKKLVLTKQKKNYRMYMCFWFFFTCSNDNSLSKIMIGSGSELIIFVWPTHSDTDLLYLICNSACNFFLPVSDVCQVFLVNSYLLPMGTYFLKTA